jgi:hypothetical protein
LWHLAPEITYTTDRRDYWTDVRWDTLAPEDLRSEGTPDPNRAQVFFVVAAFDSARSPRIKTFAFGLGDYGGDEALHFEAWGPCVPRFTEIASPGWPGPGTGTGVYLPDTVLTGRVVPLYWFAAYVYVPTRLELGDHPNRQIGVAFANDATPAEEDKVEALGVLGFGVPGQNPLPRPPVQPGDGGTSSKQ